MVRGQSPEADRLIDRHLLGQIENLGQGLRKAKENLAALKRSLDRLTQPPWHVATFEEVVPGREQVLVSYRGESRVVTLNEGLKVDMFGVGDEVFLNHELNLLLGKTPWAVPRVGEMAEFQRYTSDGRLVLRSHNEDQFVARPAAKLAPCDLREGDTVRWDRQRCLAYERIEREITHRYFIEDILDVGPEQVGGQRAALSAFVAALTTVLSDRAKAAAYGLDSGRHTILLVGPPGCGKTLLGRLGAAESTRIHGKKCHFALVKPAEWENKYVGATQENIRNCFDSLKRTAGEDEQVLLFLDEVEAVGRVRGEAMGYHSDKFLAALLAELDGFSARGGVAIVSATNRKDLIDPALLERLSDVEIHVPRPNMRAAREIFEIHLAESLPFSPNGTAARSTRSQIIDRAVSLFFDPNADNDLCIAKFSDGRERTITAGELMSGRLIEQVSRAARQRAFLRDVRGGVPGIRAEDMEEAVADAIERLSTTLSTRNIRSYLTDLPQDINIVSVEPIVRRTRRLHRYRNDD
jgi:proteasome-associated ATPase